MPRPAEHPAADAPFHAAGTRRALGETVLFVREGGAEAGTPVVFLHGFPEHGGAWRPVIEALGGKRRWLAPDLRGYGWSDRPAGVSAYTTDALVRDVAALAEYAGAPVDLVGHDWGGVLAWWTAIRHPALVRSLTVCNAPHPAALQQALIDDPAQRAASQYMTALRAPGIATRFLTDPEAFWDAGTGRHPSLTGEDRAGYLAAWRQPGAVEAMANWYRAAPFVVPAPQDAAAVPEWARDPALRLKVPATIVWGMDDPVLLPALIAASAAWCDDVRVIEVAGAGHGVIHEAPRAVAAASLGDSA